MARVLIAEDNHEIRGLVRRVLERDDLEVEEVEDGDAAIVKISARHYDAILLEFMMPGASGFDVIDWINANRPELAKACVIVMTGAIHQLRHVDADRVFAVVKKPFDVFELREI